MEHGKIKADYRIDDGGGRRLAEWFFGDGQPVYG
jgi:hypothetical protein